MRLRFACPVLSLVLLAACGGATNSNSDAGSDALALLDSSAPSDVAASPDAVPPTTDAGAPDSLVGPDATDPVDVVSPPDGTAPSDAMSAPDSILPPVDAGNPFADAGPLGPPAMVPVTVLTSGTCPALTPCGGDVVGTWDVTGACIEVPIGMAIAACPGAMITHAGGTAQGRVSFDGTVAHRVAQSQTEVDVFVPAVCASFVGGCAGIATAIQRVQPDSACVTSASGDCNCAARQVTNIDNTDLYTTPMDTIVGTGSGKRFAYCVASDTLRYQDVTPTGPREPGIITLGRR